MYDDKLVIGQIVALQNKFDLTDKEFAESIGVTGAYIGQIKRGIKKLSSKRVKKICDIYNIDHTELIKDESEKDIGIHESIGNMMRIKNVDIYAMEKMTGISAINISQIIRGKITPSPEDIKKISNALGTRIETLEQGSILRNLEVIRRALEELNLSPEVVDLHVRAIEREL